MNQLKTEIRAALVDALPERKSGRAVFDDGRTVWEWQTATGVFSRQVSHEQLIRLEASNLCLVEQPAPAKDTGLAIYGSRQSMRNDVDGRRSQSVKRSEFIGAFRQLWRRLVPST
jgi:hypothetical protein